MLIQPLILGSGNAAKAILKSLAIIPIIDPKITLADPLQLERNQSLEGIVKDPRMTLLCIANPHGLHAQTLLRAEAAGINHIVCEKPACVSIDEVKSLRGVRASVGVLHGYRQMWGPKIIKDLLTSGALGKIISIEGHYWQSSAAQRALNTSARTSSWKNFPDLSGKFDTLLDLAPHWVDLAYYLVGEAATSVRGWASFVNAEMPHRDTHLHLDFKFSSGTRARTSVSKTVHGATNDLEISVFGENSSAAWNFIKPDEVQIGRGNSTTLLRREESKLGSFQAPFHATGWLEGYIEILHQTLLHMTDQRALNCPTLVEHLDVMESLLSLTLER